jgi:hypothetical protein
MAQKKRQIYKVIFFNQGKVYEVYARSVNQGGLFGLVEVEGLLFGERTTVVVDPSEEALQLEFSGVERFYIPLHSVIRIDQVEKGGAAKIVQVQESGGKVTPWPAPIYTPAKKEN